MDKIKNFKKVMNDDIEDTELVMDAGIEIFKMEFLMMKIVELIEEIVKLKMEIFELFKKIVKMMNEKSFELRKEQKRRRGSQRDQGNQDGDDQAVLAGRG